MMLARLLLAGLLAGSLGAAGATPGRAVEPFTGRLQPGDYVWRPEVSPAGPVVVLIRLDQQTLYVFRNGVRIGRSTVSTGQPGHRTPTGAFTVLEKQVHHVSSIYRGAQMPYMQRLTWRGVALHAGHLPGRPASHGCIRLPYAFAQKLYAVTGRGTTVLIAAGDARAGISTRPGLLFQPGGPPLPPGSFEWQPTRAPEGPVTLVVSSADGEVRVLRGGVPIGRAAFAPQSGLVCGTQVFTALDRREPDGRRSWLATVSLGRGRAVEVAELARQLPLPEAFRAHVREVIAPGTTLVVTDRPAGPRALEPRDLLQAQPNPIRRR
ncbi:MAG: L,D-transpeptidase family protein [Verrucomicrobia bacterium]|nr:L,D-transpeptidase family protein [Verrucomicrobiota bacterium]